MRLVMRHYVGIDAHNGTLWLLGRMQGAGLICLQPCTPVTRKYHARTLVPLVFSQTFGKVLAPSYTLHLTMQVTDMTAFTTPHA